MKNNLNFIERYMNFFMGVHLRLSIAPVIIGAGINALGGIASSLLGKKGSKTSAPPPTHDRGLVQRGLAIRKQEAFPEILSIRSEFDPKFIEQNIRNTRQAQSGIASLLGDEVTESIGRQRGQLFESDIDRLQDVTPGLFGAQKLTGELQRQAQEGLALGGELSAEDIRASEQSIGAATQRRGRGSGAFAVGQLALGRDAARRTRRDERRQFAGQSAQLGIQTAQPFLGIQARNNQLVGSPLQQLSAALGLGASAPDVPVFDPNVVNIAQGNQGIQANASSQAAASRSSRNAGLLSGGLSAAGQIGGSLFGQGGGLSSIFGGGNSDQEQFDLGVLSDRGSSAESIFSSLG